MHKDGVTATVLDLQHTIEFVAYMELAWPPAYADHHRGAAVDADQGSGLTIDKDD